MYPTEAFALYRRAAVYLAIGNTEAAKADLAKAMELSTDDASVLYDHAVVLVLYNRHADAIKALKLAFEHDPSERIYAQTDDLLDPLRNLPEFQELMRVV